MLFAQQPARFFFAPSQRRPPINGRHAHEINSVWVIICTRGLCQDSQPTAWGEGICSLKMLCTTIFRTKGTSHRPFVRRRKGADPEFEKGRSRPELQRPTCFLSAPRQLKIRGQGSMVSIFPTTEKLWVVAQCWRVAACRGASFEGVKVSA